MLIVGDVHGKIKQYRDLIENAESSFQLGDMGLGFADVYLPLMDKNHKFIRGNHDNPEVCRNHPNYAGEYGYISEQKLFYLGGAWSIDQAWRIEGKSWWRDEEQSYEELQKALDLYKETKPEVVLTHDCPEKIGEIIVASNNVYIIGFDINGDPVQEKKIPTRTGQALQRMWEEHRPKLWLFGHYHIEFDFTLGTRFKCLQELETFEI